MNNKNKNEKQQHCVKLTAVLLFVTQGEELPEERQFLLGIYVKSCWI